MKHWLILFGLFLCLFVRASGSVKAQSCSGSGTDTISTCVSTGTSYTCGSGSVTISCAWDGSACTRGSKSCSGCTMGPGNTSCSPECIGSTTSGGCSADGGGSGGSGGGGGGCSGPGAKPNNLSYYCSGNSVVFTWDSATNPSAWWAVNMDYNGGQQSRNSSPASWRSYTWTPGSLPVSGTATVVGLDCNANGGSQYTSSIPFNCASTPTCTVSGSTDVCAGSPTTYTVTGSSANSYGMYVSPQSVVNGWSNVAVNVPSGASATYTYPSAGSYYMVCNGNNASGIACTGNPWVSSPPQCLGNPRLNVTARDCSMSCSISPNKTTLAVGESLSATVSGGGVGLNQVWGYMSPTSSQAWTQVAYSPSSSASGSWTCPAAGQYYLVCNAGSSNGSFCSGNPWGGAPDCGGSDMQVITCNQPQPVCTSCTVGVSSSSVAMSTNSTTPFGAVASGANCTPASITATVNAGLVSTSPASVSGGTFNTSISAGASAGTTSITFRGTMTNGVSCTNTVPVTVSQTQICTPNALEATCNGAGACGTCGRRQCNSSGTAWLGSCVPDNNCSASCVPTSTPTPPGGSCTASILPAPGYISPSGTITAGTQTITWPTVAGATSYALRIDDKAVPWNNTCPPSGDANDRCLTVNTNSYTYTFQAGHTYDIWVHAMNCAGYGTAVVTSVTVTNPPPPPPTGSCSVTTSPSVLNLNTGNSAVVSANVAVSGSVGITKVDFGSYATSVASVSPVTDSSSPYSTTVTANATGLTAVWATATLSNGATCSAGGSVDTDVNVSTIVIPPTAIPLPTATPTLIPTPTFTPTPTPIPCTASIASVSPSSLTMEVGSGGQSVTVNTTVSSGCSTKSLTTISSGTVGTVSGVTWSGNSARFSVTPSATASGNGSITATLYANGQPWASVNIPVTITCTAPGNPNNLNASDGIFKINLSWSAAARATGYLLYRDGTTIPVPPAAPIIRSTSYIDGPEANLCGPGHTYRLYALDETKPAQCQLSQNYAETIGRCEDYKAWFASAGGGVGASGTINSDMPSWAGGSYGSFPAIYLSDVLPPTNPAPGMAMARTFTGFTANQTNTNRWGLEGLPGWANLVAKPENMYTSIFERVAARATPVIASSFTSPAGAGNTITVAGPNGGTVGIRVLRIPYSYNVTTPVTVTAPTIVFVDGNLDINAPVAVSSNLLAVIVSGYINIGSTVGDSNTFVDPSLNTVNYDTTTGTGRDIRLSSVTPDLTGIYWAQGTISAGGKDLNLSPIRYRMLKIDGALLGMSGVRFGRDVRGPYPAEYVQFRPDFVYYLQQIGLRKKTYQELVSP